MAKVTHYNTKDKFSTIRGAYRTLFVRQDGAEYKIYQFGHIDDSGNQKRRDWGRFDSHDEAVKAAVQKSNARFG